MKYAEFRPLETQRMILRKLQMEDIYEYYERLFGDADVSRYMMFSPHQDISESMESLQWKLKRYEEGNCYCWGVTLKEEDGLIGLIELLRFDEETDSCSFVYLLGCNYWGKGFATEALKAVIDFAFDDLQIQRIRADHMAKNPASGAVMRKAGMKHIATEPEKYEKMGQRMDAEVYEIRNERNTGLTANDYQHLAMKTLNPELSWKDVLINGVMGLCGESGEAIDIVKKWLAQGHPLDKERLAKELGDIAWYLAETATALDLKLEDVLQGKDRKSVV